MVFATFNSTTGRVGRAITNDDAVFALEGHGVILPTDVLAYDYQGHISWALEDLKELWSSSPQRTGSPSTAPPTAERRAWTTATWASSSPPRTAASFGARRSRGEARSWAQPSATPGVGGTRGCATDMAGRFRATAPRPPPPAVPCARGPSRPLLHVLYHGARQP